MAYYFKIDLSTSIAQDVLRVSEGDHHQIRSSKLKERFDGGPCEKVAQS